MAVNGNINVNVSFLDKDEQDNVDTEKTITLSSSDIYSGGKIAVVSGTVGTSSGVVVWSSTEPSLYVNASGEAVSITAITSISLYSPQNCRMIGSPLSGGPLMASVGKVATASPVASPASISVQGTGGTASYVVVIYGD